MGKRISFLIVFLLSGTFLQGATGFGARSIGLGEAFTALSDDANALWYNPAGAVQSPRRQGVLGYTKLFAGLEDVDIGMNAASFIWPLSEVGGCWGLGYTSLTNDIFEKRAISFMAAVSLKQWIPVLPGEMSVGGTVHRLRQKFNLEGGAQIDSIFAQGNSKEATVFDMGFWMKPVPEKLPGLSLGLVGKSLNEADIGFVQEEKLPKTLMAGAAYQVHRLTVAVDFVRFEKENELRAGLEYWPLQKRLGVRAGVQETAISSGLSVKIGPWAALEYTYSLPRDLKESAGSHHTSLLFYF